MITDYKRIKEELNEIDQELFGLIPVKIADFLWDIDENHQIIDFAVVPHVKEVINQERYRKLGASSGSVFCDWEKMEPIEQLSEAIHIILEDDLPKSLHEKWFTELGRVKEFQAIRYFLFVRFCKDENLDLQNYLWNLYAMSNDWDYNKLIKNEGKK